MSQKTAKAVRREQKEKINDFNVRRNSMMTELRGLSEKYRIDIIGSLQYTQQGIVPMVAFVDVKEQYEHMTEEAQKAEAAKAANGDFKTKLKI